MQTRLRTKDENSSSNLDANQDVLENLRCVVDALMAPDIDAGRRTGCITSISEIGVCCICEKYGSVGEDVVYFEHIYYVLATNCNEFKSILQSAEAQS